MLTGAGLPTLASRYASLFKILTFLTEHLTTTLPRLGYPGGSDDSGLDTLTPEQKATGIKMRSLLLSVQTALLNNVGSPYGASHSWARHTLAAEREIIARTAVHLDLGKATGHVTNGGTEGNLTALWWSREWLKTKHSGRLAMMTVVLLACASP